MAGQHIRIVNTTVTHGRRWFVQREGVVALPQLAFIRSFHNKENISQFAEIGEVRMKIEKVNSKQRTATSSLFYRPTSTNALLVNGGYKSISRCNFSSKRTVCSHSNILSHNLVKHFHTSSHRHTGSASNSTKDTQTASPLHHPTQPAQCTDTLIETWFYTVAPRGTINLNLPFSTVVYPLNPQSHPNMDKVIIEVHYDRLCVEEGEVLASHELSRIGELYNLGVTFDENVARMNVSGSVTPGVGLPLVCVMWMPLQSDLCAVVESNKDLTVEKLESNSINLSLGGGNCNLKSLKCGSVSVQCKGGNISCRSTLLGNVNFQTGGTGGITADKVQGSSILCETEMGGLHIKSLYADTAVVRTTGGWVRLGQCHGQVLLQAGQSDVTVESLEGDIDAGIHSGDVSVHLSRHFKSNIDVNNGNIKLSFPESVCTDISLDSRTVTVDENTAVKFEQTDQPHHKEGYIGKKGISSIHARTLSGNIDVKLLDWIHTTKLAFKKD